MISISVFAAEQLHICTGISSSRKKLYASWALRTVLGFIYMNSGFVVEVPRAIGVRDFIFTFQKNLVSVYLYFSTCNLQLTEKFQPKPLSIYRRAIRE